MKNIRQKLSGKIWIKAVGFCFLPLYIFACFVVTEYANLGTFAKVFGFIADSPLIFVAAMITLFILSAFLLLLTKKLWIYTAVFGVLTYGMGLVNCLKMSGNGDNFLPWDITMLGDTGDLLSFAKPNIPIGLFIWPALIVIISFGMWFINVGIDLHWFWRLPMAFAIALVTVIVFNIPSASQAAFGIFGISFDDAITQSENYSKNGFINAFTLNIFTLSVSEPDGYTETVIDSYLEKYDGEGGTTSPNVIAIMAESFSDIRELGGTTFSVDPMQNFDEISLRENAVSGTFYTTAYGGGTVRSEFDFITGLASHALTNETSPWLHLTGETETYVSVYRDQGYTTTAIHPYDGEFYNRRAAYEYIGFDVFYDQTYIEANFTPTYRRGFITDNTFADVVIDTLEKNTGSPNFIFGITMENHGGYEKSSDSDIVVQVQNDRIDQEQLDAVTTYTQGIYYTDLMLKKIVDYVDSCNTPTVVVFFGDHKSVFGTHEVAYNQAGNLDSSDGYDVEELKFIYSTPYLVYANYDLDFGKLEKENELSGYYILSLVAEATGTKMTPYMQFLADSVRALPYYNTRIALPLNLTEQRISKAITVITHDRISGKRYSIKGG